MSYSPAVIDTFGGLDLSDDPEQVGLNAAVDLLDVDVTERGRLRARGGTSTFAARTGTPLALYADHGGLVFGGWRSNDATVAYDQTTGTATVDGAPATGTAFVSVGTPTASTTYFLSGGTIRKYTAGAFASTSVSGFFERLAVSPVDNRLVTAGNAPPSGGISRVAFSDPGAPETFPANNYVDLDPGDNESIVGLVTWHDRIFAFKQSKFFVFTGTSTGPTGGPIFNYLPVRSGVGALSGFRFDTSAVAADDGVYFIGRDGIYRTTSDLPVKVSGALDPWFAGDALPLGQHLPTRDPSSATQSLSSTGRTVRYRSGSKTFVYDVITGQWTLHNLPTYSATAIPGTDSVMVGIGGKIVRQGIAYPDDDGTPIAWTYRTGASDLGTPQQKVIRGARAWGNGTPALSVFSDHSTTDPGSAAITLATAPAVTQGVQSFSRKGTFFSVGLSGTGPATIHRAELDIRDVRLAGTS